MKHTKGLRFSAQGLGAPGDRTKTVVLIADYDHLRRKKGVRESRIMRQAKVDAGYVNTLIEQDEARSAAFQKLKASDEDVLVNLGNLRGARMEQVELNAEYELMVQDYLDTFNHAVTQGVAPIRALYAMCQGFGITLGCALRADLPFDVAKALVQMITTTASAQEKMLRAITQSMPTN